MSNPTCTMSVWASEMSRALYVLGFVQRCQFPMESIQLKEHQGKGTHVRASIQVPDAERGSLERRLDSIVGVVQARVAPENTTPQCLS